MVLLPSPGKGYPNLRGWLKRASIMTLELNLLLLEDRNRTVSKMRYFNAMYKARDIKTNTVVSNMIQQIPAKSCNTNYEEVHL
jgi:hypothetical protein